MSKSKAPGKQFSPKQWGMGKSFTPKTQSVRPADPHQKKLICTVSGAKPRFRSEEFAIWAAVIEGDSGPQQITIKGPLVNVNSGEQLACKGRWREHPKHGWGFEVTDYRSALPQNEIGVAAWLESRVDGVGPTFAKAITAHFGADKVFEVLDADPSRLAEVRSEKGRSLPKKQVDRAIAAWDDAKAIRQIETFLFSHGISPKLAARLYAYYGDEVTAVLQNRPYELTTLRGIGFLTADAIALSLGTDPGDPERIKSGIIYVLEQAADSEGHAYLPIKELLAETSTALKISGGRAIIAAADQLALEGKIIVEDDESQNQRVYLQRWHELETRLARMIRDALKPTELPLFDDPERPTAPDGATPEEVERLRLPTDEQWEIMELVRMNRLAILSGNPGVGKTASVDLIIKLAEQQSLNVKLAAPTGKAARRMQELTGHPASTIHRLLGFSFEVGEGAGGFTHNEENPIKADLIVIDEASMLPLQLTHSLMRAVGPETHLLLVGDPDQLPPIGVGKVLDDLISADVVPRVHLSKIFRQAAKSMIIQNSRQINSGEYPYRRKEEAERLIGHEMLNDFFWVEKKDADDVFELIVDMATDKVREAFELDPLTDVMVLAPMRKGRVGLERLNKALEERLNSDSRGRPKKPILPERGICVGSRIVQSKNDWDPQRMIMNGELAVVLDYDHEEAKALLSLDDGERELWMPVADMHSFHLAWAMSIHKSQGSQFPCVITPVSYSTYKMLSRALIYTACTRAESLCVMVGDKRALRTGLDRVDTEKRNSTLVPRIKDPKLSGELF